MGRVASPSLSQLVAAKFKWITFSFFVGFGLAACAGDDAVEEPVAAETSDASTDDAVASEDGEMNVEQASAEEPQVPEASEEESLEGDMAAASDDPSDTAAPPEIMDQSSDAVNAELTTEDTAPGLDPEPSLGDSMADTEEVADVSAPAAETSTDTAGMFQAPAPTPIAEAAPTYSSIPGQVSSPGAAANLPSAPVSAQQASTSSFAASSGDQASYVVQSGDTLARIASRIYGNYTHWQELASANNLNAPYVIFPGDELRFPLSNNKSKSFAAKINQARKTVVVKAGDTLSTLAQELFGSQASWKVFLSYNKGKIANPHRIPAGMKLAYVDFGGGHHAAAKPKKAAIVNNPQPTAVQPTAAPVAPVEPAPAAAQETAPAAEAAPAGAAAEQEAPVIEEEAPIEDEANLDE